MVAEVLALLGLLDGMMDNAKESAEYSERALWLAEAIRHDEVAAGAAVALVGIVGYSSGGRKRASVGAASPTPS